MNNKEYETIQHRLSELMDGKRLQRMGILSGKRKEGYEEAILAVKSMISREFKPLGDSEVENEQRK